MEYKDYYQVLGVPRNAGQAEIKKAFRRLAREHHPDLKPGDKAAEQSFKDVNEANEVLSDPAKRKQYDLLGANWDAYARAGGRPGADPFGPGGPFAGFGGSGRGGNVRYEFRTGGDTNGFSDFFRTFFGGAAAGAGAAGAGATRDAGRGSRRAAGLSFDEILDQMGAEGGGFTRAGQRAPGSGGSSGRPAPVEAEVDLGLEEAFHGTSRIVEVDGKRLEVQVPRGVDSGSRIRLRGKGGGTGANARDLYLVTKVRSHPVFGRKGADLTRELSVSLAEALLGEDVPVGTLKGRVLLTIPAGTQTGRTFRLAGQGMPRLNKEGSGDLYVKIRVVIPTSLTPEAEAAAHDFLALVHQPNPRTES
jgi:DnaJ-class molecular chaperone